MKSKGFIYIITAMAIGIFACLLFLINVFETQTTQVGSGDKVKTNIANAQTIQPESKHRQGTLKSSHPFVYLQPQQNEDIDEDDELTEDRTTPEERARLAAMYEAVGDDYFTRAPDAFDEVMEEEPIDHMWTGIVTAALNKGFESGAFEGSTLLDAECHRTMCRIRLTYEDKVAMSRFWNENGKEEALVGPSAGFSHVVEDGAIESSIYMGKYAEDYQFEKAAVDRLYEMVTGQSADGVVPTESQIAAQMATRPSS